MTLAALRATSGRQPFTFIEIHMDSCDNTYGSSPCTAAVGTTGVRKCYNTFVTCQDKDHYVNVDKVYTFCSANQRYNLGGSTFDAKNAIPCIRDVSFVPTRIERKGGISQRASISVKLMDTEHNDSGLDKYLADRTHDVSQGTFFGKFLARNPFYYQRKMVVSTGYLSDDGTVDPANFQTAVYFLDKIDGPDANGNVTITAKDVLTFIDSDKAQLPPATALTLDGPISNSATSVTLVCADTSTDVPHTDGYMAIDSEIVRYTVNSTDATHAYCTFVRGALGTEAIAHDSGAKAQDCYIIGAVDEVTARADEAMYQMLIDGGVDAGYIDHTEFTTEGDDWGVDVTVFGIVPAPTGVKDLVKSLCEQTGSYIWFDVRTQKVNFRLNRPALTDEITEVGEDYNICEQSLAVKVDDAERLSNVYFFFDIIDPTTDFDNPSNYRRIYEYANLGASDPVGFQYKTERIRKIFGRWVPAVAQASAFAVAENLGNSYSKPLTTITFSMDSKDAALWSGDTLRIDARGFVDDTGARKPVIAIVTEAKETTAGSKIQVTCQVSQDPGRYMLWADDAAPDYVDATQTERDANGYWATDAILPTMPNGDDPYLWA